MDNRLLLVDDEEGIRRVLSITLMDIGYDVLTAESGEKALKIFEQQQPSIVLTDIKMPGMDGIQLLRQIKFRSPDTEVIMITGHGDMDLAVKSLQLQAVDFVTKPIHPEILEIALDRARERISMKRQLREYTEDLERLVEERTEKLLRAERLAAVGQTVAGLAHAIKNITGGLKGGMYVLDRGIELNNRSYLDNGWQMVKRNVDKISKLAMDLLHFARERQLKIRAANPNKILEDVYELMRSKAEDYSVELIYDPSPYISDIHCDPEALHECFLNLAANAVDACMDLECLDTKHSVVLRSQVNPDGAVEIQISDNGCGMDDDVKDKCFQDFFSTKGSKGTGLGLMIAKKIVDEHGGAIRLESSKDRGSTFTVTLPDNPRGDDD